MLKLRLQRMGRKRMPVFRLVVAEHTMPVQGRFLEKLGSFVGGQKATTLNINTERVKYWISVGAQPSQTVAQILVKQGVKEAEKFVAKRVQKPSNASIEAKVAAEAAVKAKEEAAAAAKAEKEAAHAAGLEAQAAAEAAEKAAAEAVPVAEVATEETPAA
jgi:small subunit ribosomal protein S16